MTVSHVVPDFSKSGIELQSEKPHEMLTVTRSNGVTKVRINSSSLGVILACPRKSYYTLKRGLRSKVGSPALVYGSAIHKALEIFYSHPREERAIPPRFKEKSEQMAFGHSPESEHFLFKAVESFVTEAQQLRMLPDTDKRSLSSGIWLLQNYFNTYINDPYVVYSDENGPVTERKFTLTLYKDTSLEVELFGTIDVVLQHEVNKVILPADHKTSSVVGNDFFNRLKPNHQYTGYILGAQQVLGIDSDQFLVNCLQVKARPLTARGSGPHFTRQVTKRSDQDIQEFKEAVLWAVRSYLLWDETNVWPIGHVDQCGMYGGCQYLDICGAPDQLRENMIEAKFNEGSV